ncbi:MAG TPA: hypothetical protein PLR25_13465 [Planctomycetaceae bacterium]|nr:hypothetical protein [Planctomycetaceae bacterium]
MKKFNHQPLALVALLALAFFSGCGEGVKEGPVEKLVSGSGCIKVDGEPAGAVRIRLTPINDTKSVGGSWAVTKDDGTFSLTHWTNEAGIAPGSYLITFSKLVKPDGSPLGEKDSPALVQAKETISTNWSNPEPDQMAIQARRVDIPEGGKQDIDFSITSAGNN